MNTKQFDKPRLEGGRTADGRLAISIMEASRVLGVSRTTAYLMASEGALLTIKARGRLLVPVAALQRLLAGEVT